MGLIQETHQFTRTLPSEMSPCHLGYKVAGPHHQYRGPGEGRFPKHRSHLDAATAALGWAGCANGRLQNAKVCRLYGQLSYGKRSIGAPGRCYKDQLKQQLARGGVVHRNWQTLALENSSWRTLTKRAVQNFQRGRVRAAQE